MTNRIGVLGDFNPEYPSHVTIGTSLQHAGRVPGSFARFAGWCASLILPTAYAVGYGLTRASRAGRAAPVLRQSTAGRR